jgi:uncharacterized membrane protein YeaQ/YmgE (transglycosylase-associated protein family)
MGVKQTALTALRRHAPKEALMRSSVLTSCGLDISCVSLATAVMAACYHSPPDRQANHGGSDTRRKFMIEFLVMIVVGLIVGAVGKLVMPGNDPGGIIVTILIGIAGSVVGGYLGRAIGLYQSGQAAGFIMSVVGAVVLLFAYRMLTRQRA